MVLLLKVKELWTAKVETIVFIRISREVDVEGGQTIDILIGERFEENAIEYAEDHRGRADSKGKGKDGNGRKARALRKRPQTVANILPNTGQRETSQGSNRIL